MIFVNIFYKFTTDKRFLQTKFTLTRVLGNN